MDKAPDAFRTISEVADDLDIPQHVLRFWETRFTQIKPMKRSGGRRYYRPDDVDLLKGIRRLLYGEGYTIRGVQRILKEHGIASVQRLADARRWPRSERSKRRSAKASWNGTTTPRPASTSMTTITRAPTASISACSNTDEEGMPAAFDDGPIPGVAARGARLDVARLEGVLQDLIACRQLLDQALKDWLAARLRAEPALSVRREPIACLARGPDQAKGTASERGAARLAH